MALVLANNFGQTTLAGPLSTTSVVAFLASGSGALFPNPVGGQYFALTLNDQATGQLYEIIYVTNRSGDRLTIQRGQENTSPLTWQAGDLVLGNMTAGMYEQAAQMFSTSAANPNGNVAGDALRTNLGLGPTLCWAGGLLWGCIRGGNESNAIWTVPTAPTAGGGFVNKFRNAAFEVWQRGISGVVTANTRAYTADGWAVVCAGQAVTWSRDSGSTNATYTIQLIGGAGMTDTYISQRIESDLASFLAGNFITVQFSIFNGTGDPFTPTIQVIAAGTTNSWSSSTVIVNDSLQLCPNNQVTTVAYNFIASATSARGLEIRVDFGNALNSGSASVRVGDADIRNVSPLPVGTNNSPAVPDLRPFWYESLFCQRYLPAAASGQNTVSSGVGIATMSFGGFGGDTVGYTPIPFQTPSLSTTTGIFLSSPNDFGISYLSLPRVATTNITINSVGLNGATLFVYDDNHPGRYTQGNAAVLSAINNGATLLFLGSEL